MPNSASTFMQLFIPKQFLFLNTGSAGQPDANGFGSQSNLGYSTLGNQQAIVQENPTYKSSNTQNNEPRFQEDPGYATPDFKRKETERVNSYPEAGYESADLRTKEVNAVPSDSMYSTPDKNTGEKNPDLKRVEVNGELYALPDKKVRQFLNRRMLKEVASSNINDII